MLDVEGYIERVEPIFAKGGFYETEIARRTEQFGRIAHVWSTYESRHSRDDRDPFMRGINSFQLFHDGKRWWIVNIFWQHESPTIHCRSCILPESFTCRLTLFWLFGFQFFSFPLSHEDSPRSRS